MMTDHIDQWIEEWRQKGALVDVHGKSIFCVDLPNNSAPVIAVLHGYPSSSFDFRHVIADWNRNHRVVLHDHPGFGLSAKPTDYSYSLKEQARIAIDLWRHLGLTDIHLVAHDYGTSVCTEILALREEGQMPIRIHSVTLSNGSIHIELARLRWIQHLLLNRWTGPWVSRLGSEFIYTHQMRRLWLDRSRCDPDELRALYRMHVSGGGKVVLHQVTQYLRERYQYWDRWIGALTRLDIPAQVLWAQDDPVAVKAIGEALYQEIPGAVINRLKGIGHYPMLEDPGVWGRAVSAFVSTL